MSAPGRPTIVVGDAPDPVAAPPTVNPTRIEFNRTVQRFNIRNSEAAGGADLTFSFDGTSFIMLNAREAFWEANLRLNFVYVRSGTIGATAGYEITTVEQ